MLAFTQILITILSAILMTTGHAHASKAVQFQKQGGDQTLSHSSPPQLQRTVGSKIRLDKIVYFSPRASTDTQLETCDIGRSLNPQLQQLFSEACPPGETDDTLYVFPDNLLKNPTAFGFRVTLTWDSLYSKDIDVVHDCTTSSPAPCISCSFCKSCYPEGTHSLSDGCYCVDLFFKPSGTAGREEKERPIRLVSRCEAFEADNDSNEVSVDLTFKGDQADLACGNLEFVVFGVNPVGNGTASSLLLGLSRGREPNQRPDFVKATNTLSFNLPVSFANQDSHLQVVALACEDRKISFLPSVNTELSVDGSLMIKEGDSINIDAIYNIELTAIFLKFPSFFPEPLRPPQITAEICTSATLVRELLSVCDNRTVTVPVPEITTLEITTPEITTPAITTPETTPPSLSFPATNLGAILGSSIACLAVGAAIGVAVGIGIVVYSYRKRGSFNIPATEVAQ